MVVSTTMSAYFELSARDGLAASNTLPTSAAEQIIRRALQKIFFPNGRLPDTFDHSLLFGLRALPAESMRVDDKEKRANRWIMCRTVKERSYKRVKRTGNPHTELGTWEKTLLRERKFQQSYVNFQNNLNI
ncbi:hypothetical protein [Hartmannibacter diazotrophicus]|uniref:hypothetical protein n=1 Tax=Hartmannibacter diazotrophicus TaxID=1482074 RepID=UPI001390556F|nr:hypothetical protein [Hartmannibacter diazotrophicus]